MDMLSDEQVIRDNLNNEVKVSYLYDDPYTYFVVTMYESGQCIVYGPLENGTVGNPYSMSLAEFTQWCNELDEELNEKETEQCEV